MSIAATQRAVVAEAPEALETIVSAQRLSLEIRRKEGGAISILDGIDFSMRQGEVVGIVGESGSGKSMMARSLMRLLPETAEVTGDIRLVGQNVLSLTGPQLRKLRGGQVSMVFQDPMTSFNPVRTIGDQIGEMIRTHAPLRGAKLKQRVVELLRSVGILNPQARANDYPHAYSGGMRQRAMIAMAVANNPKLLIADEPTTALDATVQDNILELLRTLNRESGTAIALITHNIAVVASICSRVVVMYSGRIVEEGPVERVLSHPQHPYTWMLLRSVPDIDRPDQRLVSIDGVPPDPANPPSGCRFHPRCRFSQPKCSEAEPELRPTAGGGAMRCFFDMEKLIALGGVSD